MEPKKVLIIDDTTDLADALRDIVEFKGHIGLTAASGGEGLEIALREHPNLILLDIRMPDMDGFEVFRRLRQDEWGKNVKIVFLTASVTPEGIPEDITIDPGDFLMKTQWGVGNLADKIEEKLNEAA